MAGNNLLVPGSDAGGVQISDPVFLGTTETSRLIYEVDLPVDFKLTSVGLKCFTLIDANEASPLIIRVYQDGATTSAATMEVTTTGYKTHTIYVEIKESVGATRRLKIDAWDPSTSNANNSCAMTGMITVNGEPLITNSGAGASGSA
tara:strand:- start:6548 stop:6988 length:441 start_codon:yes stop_codon:yes gene_type:complete